jgi:hypothetical protein
MDSGGGGQQNQPEKSSDNPVTKNSLNYAI